MAHGPWTRKKPILAVSLLVMVAVVFALFGVYGRESDDSKYAKHTFQLDGGTHVIQIDREAKRDDNTIWFGKRSGIWNQNRILKRKGSGEERPYLLHTQPTERFTKFPGELI